MSSEVCSSAATQYPSVSIDESTNTGAPNARFWVLKLLKDNFGPGDRLVQTNINGSSVAAQAFNTSHGRSILIVNKRLRPTPRSPLPAGFTAAHITYVAPSTGDNPPASKPISGPTVELEPNEVAVIAQ